MYRGKQRKIIVSIDDNPAFAEILKVYVETETSFQFLHFTSSAKALEFLKKFPQDVACIFSDIMMKEMDGFQLLDEVRRSPVSSHLPFFFISGVEPAVFQDFLEERKYDAFLSKPLGADDLLKALEESIPEMRLDSAA